MTVTRSRMGFAVTGIVTLLLSGCSPSSEYQLVDDAEQHAARAMFAETCPNLVPEQMYFLTPKTTLDYDSGTLYGAFNNTPSFPLHNIRKEEQQDFFPYIYNRKAEFRGLILPGEYPRATAQLISIEPDNCHTFGPEKPFRYTRRTS